MKFDLILRAADFYKGTTICYWLRTIKKMNEWSNQSIREWQIEKLRSLIKHAYENTRYYKELFDNLHLNVEDIHDINDLNNIPPLTKTIIHNRFDDLIPANLKSIHHKRHATGGSTAEPLVFLLDLNSWSYTTANSTLNWNKIGYILGDKHIALGSSNIIPNNFLSISHKIFYFLKGKISFPAIQINQEVLDSYLEIIIKKRIKFIYGYASALYLLALRAREKQFNYRIEACISTSELLLPEYAKIIANTFHCKILDAYGCSDGGITAFKSELDYFEVGYNSLVRINSSDAIDPNSLLVTDLLNYAMPFINYEVGDGAVIDDGNSQTVPYNGQIIKELYGRIPNIMRFRNGKVIIAPAFTVLFSDMNVEGYRFLQLSDYELVVQIIKGNNYSAQNEKVLLDSLRYHIGEDINIRIQYEDHFNIQNSGKRNYFITKN